MRGPTSPHGAGALLGHRAGASFGDVLLVLSCLVLIAALVAPWIRRGAADERREAILAEVERLRTAAESAREDLGTWPPGGGDALPPELARDPAMAESLAGGARFEWRRLETVRVPEPTSAEVAPATPDIEGVESPEPPPPPAPELFHRGILSVHGGDEALLSTLLRRYGTEASFVQDSVWTLVLPPVRVPLPAGGGPGGGVD